MDERDLILKHFSPLATWPGADGLRDDVAEIAPGLIVTMDTIVEGVHFLPDDPIATIARKLIRANVSDIVAKGGRPTAALLALTWPNSRPHDQIGGFATALGSDLAGWGASLVGGDTTTTDGPLTLSLTLLGRVGARGPVRRSGAGVGDDLWVTGAIGDSCLGLLAATGGLGALTPQMHDILVSRYRVPSPPGLALADLVARFATSAIDVSDGLVTDADSLALASGVAVVIDAADVPLSEEASALLAGRQAELGALLTGGDDYQTLFTASPLARPELQASPGPLTRIGRIEKGAGVRLLNTDGSEMTFLRRGWRHAVGAAGP